MDIADTLAPDSDQLDAVDLLGGPQTFTITGASKGTNTGKKGDQPVNIHLAEFPRVWRPNKSMRRVLAACWGTNTDPYVGRRVTLYCDETVRFGDDVVGGTRISHLSHLKDGKPKTVPLLEGRGRSKQYRVLPLADEPTVGERVASLRAEWKHADPERRSVIEAQVAELTNKPPAGGHAPDVHGADAGSEREVAADPPAGTPDEVDPTLDPNWKAADE